MHRKVTTGVLLERQRHRCPAALAAVVGTTGVASEPRGLNMRNDYSPEIPPVPKSLYGLSWEADRLNSTGRPPPPRKKRAQALGGPPG